MHRTGRGNKKLSFRRKVQFATGNSRFPFLMLALKHLETSKINIISVSLGKVRRELFRVWKSIRGKSGQ